MDNKGKKTTNKTKINGVKVISSEALALAYEIQDKFGNNLEPIKALLHNVEIDENGVLSICFEDLNLEDSDSEQNDCCENCKTYVENTKYVSLFGYPDVEELNKVIDGFEEQFEEAPYLVMNADTLNIFEKCTRKISCIDIETDDVDCEDYDECEGCPYESDEEGTVFIDHDCETGAISAYYFHNDDDYSIVIDNDLAFGVVKVR